MNAIVTIRFKFPNVCGPEDLKFMDMTFEEMVKHLIKEEGLFGVVEDDYEFVSIEEEK